MKSYQPRRSTERIAEILRSKDYVKSVTIVPGGYTPRHARKPPTLIVTYKATLHLPEREEHMTAQLAREWAQAELRNDPQLAERFKT